MGGPALNSYPDDNNYISKYVMSKGSSKLLKIN